MSQSWVSQSIVVLKRSVISRQKMDMTYPVLLGTSEVQQTYGVDTLPTTVTVAPDGKVADVHVWSDAQASRLNGPLDEHYYSAFPLIVASWG